MCGPIGAFLVFGAEPGSTTMHHNLGKRGGKSRLYRWGRAKFAKAQRVPISAHVRPDSLCARTDYWLIAAEPALVTPGQLEGIRRVLVRQLRRLARCGGRLLVRLSPQVPRSRRKVGLRMGGAKSAFSSLVYRLRPGALLFEIRGMSEVAGINVLSAVSRRLPGFVAVRWRSGWGASNHD